MTEPFIAEIRAFPYNFAPRGWAFCNGQLLPIAQNTALFALLGITYGGDGRTTFALPGLQGAAAMHQGAGPGLTPRTIGDTGGSPFTFLNETQMPVHPHTLQASNRIGRAGTPVDAALAVSSGANVYTNQPPGGQMSTQALSVTGGGQPHNNMQPYLTLNFCIALQGIFPPRS